MFFTTKNTGHKLDGNGYRDKTGRQLLRPFTISGDFSVQRTRQLNCKHERIVACRVL